MRYIYLLIVLLCLSCNTERVLQLPEIENAEVTEVLDVSPAYIFYDETQADSTLLNRKNIITTTNWLVNVDKRLTLRQAIPYIKLLQEKKRNAGLHKNANAKNYFTCNDTSIKSLGFLEFTDVNYKLSDLIEPDEEMIIDSDIVELENLFNEDYYKQLPHNDIFWALSIFINIDMSVNYYNQNNIKLKTKNITTLIKALKDIKHKNNLELGFKLSVWFHGQLSFQDYIAIKSELSKHEEDIIINANEFIY
jgi:hypothetical protein